MSKKGIFSTHRFYRYANLPARARYEEFWKLYFFYKGSGRLILRKGFNDYGVHDQDYPARCPPSRPEYDIEHEAGTCFVAFLLFELFPEFFDGINRVEVYELLMSHDVGEIVSGDISDDGNRDDAKKDAEEFSVFKRLFEGVSVGFDRLIRNFVHFQKKNTRLAAFAYCIDKSEAVLQGLIYEVYDCGGTASFKDRFFGLSAQDRQCIKASGSDELADIWLESVRPKLLKADPTGVNFFYELLSFVIPYARHIGLSPLDDL